MLLLFTIQGFSCFVYRPPAESDNPRNIANGSSFKRKDKLFGA